MTVYISGKVSNLPICEVRAKFAAAEALLRSRGHDVLNPMSLNHEDPENWVECMSVDLVAMQGCDVVYLLPCWRDSVGARLEHSLAKAWGLTPFYSDQSPIEVLNTFSIF